MSWKVGCIERGEVDGWVEGNEGWMGRGSFGSRDTSGIITCQR